MGSTTDSDNMDALLALVYFSKDDGNQEMVKCT